MGSLSPAGVTPFGSQVTFTCSPGYTLAGAPVLACRNVSVTGAAIWDHAPPSCVRVDCGSPPQSAVPPTSPPEERITAEVEATTYGATVSYACGAAGYRLVGPSTLNCTASGQWQNAAGATLAPTGCVQKTCALLQAPEHGALRFLGGQVLGSVALLSCAPGYTAGTAATTATCVDVPDASEGVWNASLAATRCLPVDCGAPPTVPGSTVVGTGTTVNATRTYTCSAGSYGGGTLRCLASGAWSQTAEELRCVPHVCPPLELGPQARVSGASVEQPSAYGTRASVTCATGYALSSGADEAVLTCQESVWSPSEVPTCEVVDCGAPPSLASASTPTVNTDASPGSALITTCGVRGTYVCEAGHNGGGVVSCSADGRWGIEETACTVVDCGSPSSVTGANVQAVLTT